MRGSHRLARAASHICVEAQTAELQHVAALQRMLSQVHMHKDLSVESADAAIPRV